MADHSSSKPGVLPLTPGLLPNLRYDVLSGFLVFLIALPLCLGIAKASNFPPIAGIWTAVIGGILTTWLSNSQLTIKGPAAGLIVIVEGAVLELGKAAAPAGSDLATQVMYGYPLALGVGVTAGVVQILFGVLRVGRIAEMVPLTPVHGMLAAIGITIMAKMLFVTVGLSPPPGAPIDAIADVPRVFSDGNGTVAVIGLTSIVILLVFPYLKAQAGFLRLIPAQLVVLLVGIPLAAALGLSAIGQSEGNPLKYFVSVPDVVPEVLDNFKVAFMWPDFDGIATSIGIKYVVLFAVIGSIESMLSSQAVDMIDPWQRKTDQNRDLLAVGVANTICSAVGALPMISEIVRSKANLDNGARTKYANMYHGLFLLAFVLLLPFVIRMIPLAALGAMLVFTGFRLASPREFVHTYKIGAEQLVVFVTTIVVTLCTDLLIGVLSGIGLKLVLHLINGAPMKSFVRAEIEVANTDDERLSVLKVRQAAVFANWLGLKNAILAEAERHDEIQVDLSETRFIDHTTMEKLHQLKHDLAAVGKSLRVWGLEDHLALSSHPLAARRAGKKSSTSTPQSMAV